MPRYFGSPASSPPVSPVVFTVTSPPNGAWPGMQGGTPFYFNGYSYVGFATNAGGVKVAVFNHSNGVVTTRTIVADGSQSHDQHNRPALLRRSSDDKLVYALCDHDSANLHVAVTANALTSDPTISGGWGTDTNIDSQLGSTKYTYPQLFEFNGGLLLFYRDNDGLSNWEISTHALDTTNLSTGWAHFTNVVYATRAYAMAYQSSSTRLDFVVTDGSYCEDKASLYHFYYNGTNFKNSAGTNLPGSPPFAFTDLTKVYDGATNGVRSPGAIVNDGSEIAVVFPVQTGTCSGHLGTDEDYLYCRSTVGSATWTNKTVATAIGALTFEYTEGMLVIDPADIDHLIVSKRAISSLSYPFHLYDYLTADAGDTWTVTGISVSGDPDLYPNYVVGYQPELEYVWLKGTFTSQSVFYDGIQGYGTPP